ncbi:hypothetical protein Tco_0098639, partial [Tanacetum coccineum]
MECSSCGALYNKSCGCSKGGLIDKFVRDPNKTPDSSQRPPIVCVKCGNPVEGPSCQGCALWRKKLKEVWFTTCHENGINQDLLNTSESSDDNTNVVNAPREPFVVKRDPGENSSQSPPQFLLNSQNELLNSQNKLMEQMTSMCDMVGQFIQKKEEEKRIEEEQAAKDRYWKIPVCYDDDDDEESYIPLKDIIIAGLPPCVAITPVLFTKEPVDSSIMEIESILTLFENGINLCFTRYFDLMFSKDFDSLLDEFTGELTLPHSIPPGIDDVNLDPEGDILFLESLLYDNSSPRPPEEFNSENPTESFSPSPIPVEDSDSLMEEIDNFFDGDDSIPPGIESDDFDSEDDDNSTSRPEFESFHVDYPSSGDSTIDVVEDIPVDVPNILPTHPTLQLDFNFIPSNDLGSDLDVSSPSGDSNKIYDPWICIEVDSTRFLSTLSPVIKTLLLFSSKNEDKVFNHGVLASKEKSPSSPSHRGLKAFQLSPESPMLIHGDNTPNLGTGYSLKDKKMKLNRTKLSTDLERARKTEAKGSKGLKTELKRKFPDRLDNVGLVDKFVPDPNKTPDSSQRPPIVCVKCGNPVEGPSCQGCALWWKILKEVWFTTCHENGINQDLLNTSESSDDDTNVINAPREPFVVKQDPVENSSQSPPQINHNCCYEYGDSLDGIFYQQFTCKSCGKGAHIGYNCPPKAPIISNPEPCNQTIDELPQTLPSFDPTCYSEKENSLPYVSKPNFVDDSPNVFNPPPQPPIYSCEFCGNDARYGHYCTPQVPFIYPEPCYNQDFNFPQDFHDFQQQYLCCENCGGPHEIYQCQPMNEDYYHEQNSCYDPNSFGFDQFQPPQYTVNHPIFNDQNDFLNSQNKLMEQMTSIYVIWLVNLYKIRKKKSELKKSKRLKIDIGRFPFATMM